MMRTREERDRGENEKDRGDWSVGCPRAEKKVFFVGRVFFLEVETKKTSKPEC